MQKAYLFECDDLWKEPLRATFAAYSDKVSIEPLYIGDTVKAGFTTLDAVVSEKGLSENSFFVKCDIEGAEEAFLRGAQKTLATQKVDMAICLYHTADAERNITAFVSDKGWEYAYTEGYLFPVGFEKDLPYPCFRKGIIRCSTK